MENYRKGKRKEKLTKRRGNTYKDSDKKGNE